MPPRAAVRAQPAQQIVVVEVARSNRVARARALSTRFLHGTPWFSFPSCVMWRATLGARRMSTVRGMRTGPAFPTPPPKPDPLQVLTWDRIRAEAEAALSDSQLRYSYGLISLVEKSVLAHDPLAEGLAATLGSKLDQAGKSSLDFQQMCNDAFRANPEIVDAASHDLKRTLELDPAADSFLRVYLFFKGFHCIQSARVAHFFWSCGSKILASAVQSEMASTFGVDIHPASRWGRGITMDHAGGCVIGETSVIGDNVYFMHDVTLGATGTSGEHDRHPKIRDGVFLAAKCTVLVACLNGWNAALRASQRAQAMLQCSAQASVLVSQYSQGNIEIGQNAVVGAHSLVNRSVPADHVALGVPAKNRPRYARATFAPSGTPLPANAAYGEMGEGI